MAAAAPASPVSGATPLREAGTYFWGQLVDECKKQADAINSALAASGHALDDRIEWSFGDRLELTRSQLPSTNIRAGLQFEKWGPSLTISITGQESPEAGVQQKGLHVPLAADVDSSIVAIYDEGKSLSPRQVACFLMQHFRRCFPHITLPCPDSI